MFRPAPNGRTTTEVKLLGTLFASLIEERQMRRNLTALGKLFALLAVVVLLFAVGFHLIMAWEGQQYSWFTGVYWALTVMSTLGFGDITFETDVGRAFSMIVLIVGMILLLIVFPFAFIRYFYAPWLEAQLRMRAPRDVGKDMRGHLVIAAWDPIAEGLAQRLATRSTPYVVLEPDPAKASELHADGVSVVAGKLDDRSTYQKTGADRAALIVANRDDVTNTTITLTAREVAPATPVAAFATSLDSMDILELAGATHVLPLKHRLGEQLAKRADAGNTEAHVIGRFKDLEIAEFSAHGTPFQDRTIAEVNLPESTGATVVGVWARAEMLSADPDTHLSDHCVPVVVGSAAAIRRLNAMLAVAEPNPHPVIVIGAGKVGRAATRELKRKGVRVNVVDKIAERGEKLGELADRFIVGDASAIEVLEEAGVHDAPTVLLTTNDDAQNVFLAVYCRRLRPDVLILSRITHQRNVEPIHRAGADIALSYATLGVESILSLALHRESVILGEGVQLLDIPTPPGLVGKTLARSGMADSGVTVVAIHGPDGVRARPDPDEVLEMGSEIALLGNQKHIDRLVARLGKG